ncbi:MAG TPA: GTPase ObgE [Anaerolineaceae bacterium]|nr:GTPase ObgE [Anaerolineaceae bacterium]
MFIDEATIYCRSGRGGAGVVHFRREKYVPRGGPDGGDGGRGGDVVFRVDEKMNTLLNFRYRRKFIAEDGGNGRGSNMSGRGAPNLVIPVPPGTIVYDQGTSALLGDLVEPGQELTICKGGRGGRGNQHFATSRNQAPRTAEKGEPPEEREIRLELKLLADVGIVGVPNAGKSSLLAAVTNAKPKIADYPFTTIEPNLGVVRLDTETDLVLADIPGLIEGAHEGVGLGDAFLKHIQRTRVLIHVLDGSADDPLADFSQTNQELALFDSELGEKPQVVVINKIDLPGVQEKSENLLKKLRKLGYEAHQISALTRENLTPVLWKAHEILINTPKKEIAPELPTYKPREDPRDFTIEREGGGWRVKGASIERAAEMTYWEHHGSVRRFQHLMVSLGVDDALRKQGIENGDTVYILDYELEWQD